MSAMVALLALAEPAASAPATGSRWGWIGTALQLLWVLFLFALVLWLAYFTTRLVGRRFSGGSGRYLRLIDSLPLGQNRAVALVELNGEVLCVGVSEHGVNLLGRCNRAELVELTPTAAGEAPAVDVLAGSLAGLRAGLGGAIPGSLGRWFADRRRSRGRKDVGAGGATSPADAPAGHQEAGEPSGADEASEFARRMREQIERLRRIGESDRP